MNSYIQIDGKKYSTLGMDWMPTRATLSQIRPTWTGRMDVIYAPAVMKSYRGTVIVHQTAPTGYGALTDFRTAYEAANTHTFIDHYGNSMTIAFMGQVDEKSLMNTWDSASNEYHIPVQFYVVS